MAENKVDGKKAEEKKEAVKYVHLLVLGVGSITRNVQLVTESAEPPKVFVEFINAFRSGKHDLVWTPTPKNPVFAIRMNAVDFYEYRSGVARPEEKTDSVQ